MQKLELNLNELKENGLKCKIQDYFFKQTEMEYLGFWVTRYDVKPTDKDTINKNMKPLTSQK